MCCQATQAVPPNFLGFWHELSDGDEHPPGDASKFARI